MKETGLDKGHDFLAERNVDKCRESETTVCNDGRERECLECERAVVGGLAAVVLPVGESYGVGMVDGQ